MLAHTYIERDVHIITNASTVLQYNMHMRIEGINFGKIEGLSTATKTISLSLTRCEVVATYTLNVECMMEATIMSYYWHNIHSRKSA